MIIIIILTMTTRQNAFIPVTVTEPTQAVILYHESVPPTQPFVLPQPTQTATVPTVSLMEAPRRNLIGTGDLCGTFLEFPAMRMGI